MKLVKPYLWKSGMVALGVLSIVSLVSLHAVGAQTTTPTTTTTTTNNGNGGMTTDNGNGGMTTTEKGADANGADNGNVGGKVTNGKWNGGPGGRGGHGRGGWNKGGPGKMGGQVVIRRSKGMMIAGVDGQTIATYLGLTTEQLKADLDAGESLTKIAAAQGKTRDELKAFLVQKATDAIDAAIDATPATKAGPGNGAQTTPAAPNASATPTT